MAEPVSPVLEYYALPVPAQDTFDDDLFDDDSEHDQPITSGSRSSPLPARGTALSQRDVPRKRSKKRPLPPVGLIVIAILYFLGAGLMLLLAAVFVSGPLARTGGLAVLLVFFFLASLIVAVGVAMLMGAKWAWWLSAFAQALSISSAVGTILVALIFANKLVEGAVVYIVVKVFIRMVVGGSILAYLVNDDVLAFFRLKRLDPGQALSILFTIAITVTLLLNGLGYFLLRGRFGP